MTLSLIDKTTLAILSNSKQPQDTGAGGKLTFNVDLTGGLISELAVRFRVSAAFAVAPTGVDVRQFIERVNVMSSDGALVDSYSGQQIYDMVRVTEKVMTPILTPGAGGGATGTVQYAQEIHFEMDGAAFDLSTGIDGSVQNQTKLDVEFVMASAAKASTIGFTGGTFAAVPALTYHAEGEVYSYPAMAGRPHQGQPDDLAVFIHKQMGKEQSGTTSGMITIQLDPQNLTRFIGLHVDNIAGGVDAAAPSDAIVGTVKLQQGNNVSRDVTFASMRALAQQKRDVNVVGFGLIDFGDFDPGFLILGNQPVQLQVQVVAGAPAWRLQVSHDYKVPRNPV